MDISEGTSGRLTPTRRGADSSPASGSATVNVRWFIQRNYTPNEGDGAFLAPATERTQHLRKRLQELFVEERKKARGMLYSIFD